MKNIKIKIERHKNKSSYDEGLFCSISVKFSAIGEIENLEVDWAKNHFGEENYTGQQLDRITDLKIDSFNQKCHPSTYQSRTISELLDKIGED